MRLEGNPLAFTDTGVVADLSLKDNISIRNDHGYWITGYVVELSLLGDAETDIQVTVKTASGETFHLDRTPDTMIIYEWADDEESS